MTDTKVKAVFFDLGNVLVRFDVGILGKSLSPHSKVKDPDFESYVADSPDVNRYMEGKISSSQFYNRTKRHFKLDISYSDFYRAWNGIFYPYPEVENIVRSIKKKYPDIRLILVSNTNETHYSYLEKEYDVLEAFDEKILSHEVGCQKPDPDIFMKALSVSGALPKDIFYTDDRLDLIEAARVIGIRAYQFTSHDKLTSDLAKVNILV
ncbi:MAG: HAD family phosphatase [Candidatus Omnitrophota bacterium]